MNLAESLNDFVQNENETTNIRYKTLREVHRLQKSIVRQNMHNAMSPISAISGYLELINISLKKEADLEQIEHYRKQIETGISEVNVILEQLMEIYSEESNNTDTGQGVMLDVELSWLVSEVCKQMRFKKPNLFLNNDSEPVYVHTDVFMAKLILFNLINFALKSARKGEDVTMDTDKSENSAVFSINFGVSPSIKEDMLLLMSDNAGDIEKLKVAKNSFNEGLLNSRKLAEQIGGTITYDHTDDTHVVLKLYVPLANSTN